jgi:hypothetical protein
LFAKGDRAVIKRITDSTTPFSFVDQQIIAKIQSSAETHDGSSDALFQPVFVM